MNLKPNNLLYTVKGAEAHNLVFGYETPIKLPRGLTFVIGKSGSGKSTLLAFLGLLLDFKKGEIIYHTPSEYYNYHNLTQSDKRKIRKQYYGYIFQQAHILGYLSVKENLQLANFLKRNSANFDDNLEYLDLGIGNYSRTKNFIEYNPGSISGGERARVGVARGVALLPNVKKGVLFADEPTADQDCFQEEKIMTLLSRMVKEREHSVIVVTHNLFLTVKYAQHILILKRNNCYVSTELINNRAKSEIKLDLIKRKLDENF